METKTCKIRKMAVGHGDKLLTSYDPMVESDVLAARGVWDREVVGRGVFAYSVEGEGNNRLLREFEPVDDLLIVPAISGG